MMTLFKIRAVSFLLLISLIFSTQNAFAFDRFSLAASRSKSQPMGPVQLPAAAPYVGVTAPIPQQSLAASSPLSAPTPAVQAAVITEPPPVVITKPAPPGVRDETGSIAYLAANYFADLGGYPPGSYMAQQAAIRARYLTGVNTNRVTSYHVYNNKNELKRVEEFIYTDATKTTLAFQINRHYDESREVHVYTYHTNPISKRCFLASTTMECGTFVKQWDIYQANRPHPERLLLTGARTFSTHNGKNTAWWSHEYDAFGRKTRSFDKNPDASVKRIITYNPVTGNITNIENRNPVVRPQHFLGPIYQRMMTRN